jgi:GDP-L-fucose synthase
MAGAEGMDQTNEKIYVAGHRGMVGSAIVRALQQQGHTNFVTRTHAELSGAACKSSCS